VVRAAGSRAMMCVPDRWLNVSHGVRQASAEEWSRFHEYQTLEHARLAWERRGKRVGRQHGLVAPGACTFDYGAICPR
jgi:hypothetical protein